MTRVTAGWPFEAVRSFESAERTEAHLDLTASLHRVPTCDDVWKYLYMHLVQFLLVSPYLSRDHLLDLRTVGKQEQLLAKALIVMAPEQQDYATAPYPGAFNWPTVFKALELLVHADGHHWKQQDFYVIVFRSLLAPAADYSRLSRMDEVAHAEATRSGGLLKYWFGEPDGNSRNLATCKAFLMNRCNH